MTQAQNQNNSHESKWTASIAVGSENYIDKIRNLFGIKATGRRKINSQEVCELREPISPYNDVFTPEKAVSRQENLYYWNVYPVKSPC